MHRIVPKLLTSLILEHIYVQCSFATTVDRGENYTPTAASNNQPNLEHVLLYITKMLAGSRSITRCNLTSYFTSSLVAG